MKLPPILSEIAADDHVHLILSSGYMYLNKQGSAETTPTIMRLVHDKASGEWQVFDPSSISHQVRRPLVRQMYRRGLKIPEIAKIFKVDPTYVKSDIL